MRGDQQMQDPLFTYVSLEDRVPKHHPLRRIKTMVDAVLRDLSGEFDALYAPVGRPSIPPEYLLRASLLQALYSIRSETLLIEEINYNLLFRWFIGLTMDAEVWDHSTFTKNRQRLLDGEIAVKFMNRVLKYGRQHNLLSDEHFTVDGTLIEAWASQKSLQKKAASTDKRSSKDDDPGNPTVNFRGEARKNDTHQSRSDPEALLARKGPGKEAKLSFAGHVLVDNRHSLVVESEFTQATGYAEREAGLSMIKRVKRSLARIRGRSQAHRLTLGADRAYDTRGFVEKLKRLSVTPHVAQNTANGRSSAIDRRTTRHVSYRISQRKRKQVEEAFGWLKAIGPLRKIKLRGLALGGFLFTFSCAVYNILRITNILAENEVLQ
jgi:transposase